MIARNRPFFTLFLVVPVSQWYYLYVKFNNTHKKNPLKTHLETRFGEQIYKLLISILPFLTRIMSDLQLGELCI